MRLIKNQAPASILMIRPSHFGFNPLTEGSNAFQKKGNTRSAREISAKALGEFDHFVDLLQRSGINTIVYEDMDDKVLPDSVFPNNWISFHHDGTVVLYPMMAKNRRMERRKDILLDLQNKFHFNISAILDYTDYEKSKQYLEGTGSIVFDYGNEIAYSNRSPRTDGLVLEALCRELGVKEMLFKAVDKHGKDIYHTNVLMCMGTNYVIICLEAIPDENEKKELENMFKNTGHEIVEISYRQMESFAGNMIEVLNQRNEHVLVMSENAFRSLEKDQVAKLSMHATILSAPIPTIEQYGGGSARCMIAGIFLPKIGMPS